MFYGLFADKLWTKTEMEKMINQEKICTNILADLYKIKNYFSFQMHHWSLANIFNNDCTNTYCFVHSWTQTAKVELVIHQV